MIVDSDLLKISHKHGLAKYIYGSYCHKCADFDEEKFVQDWRVIFYIVFSFLKRFILMDYHAAQRDSILTMVASEIWLYNIGRSLAKGMNISDPEMNNEEFRRANLPKCNAHSISLAIGVPPQTVRRKVDQLIQMGWVERINGELVITAKCEEGFNPRANIETMKDFVSSARAVFELLNIPVDMPD